jgi:hypothetical protein
MKKLAIMVVLAATVYADNNDMFNNAYQVGKQNQFNFNLNSGSTFNSFGQANNFESNIINSANAGNATAQPMYNGAANDPNYLYNQGKADIASCQSKSDPRCTSLNKYGDKDTQTQYQAYNQGISGKYSIITKPDPSDSNCTQVIRKVPIGESTKTCVASASQQTQCHSTISISLGYHDCDPTNNTCTTWQSNPDCKLVKPYIPSSCVTWSYNIWYGCTSVTTINCANNSTFSSPCWCGRGTETRLCDGTDYIDGRGSNPVCINRTQVQLATYACKQVSYSDGCKGFK